MTFAQVEGWLIEDRPVKAAKPMILLSALSDRYREWSVSRKGFAVAGSIIVHLLLLYFFVNKLTGAAPAHQLAGAGGPSLSVFNLSGASDDRTETKSEKAASAPKRDEAIQKPVPVVPAEWKLSTISVPPAASVTTGQSISTGTSTSTPAGGGYDPYAGASPMPLTPVAANTVVNNGSPTTSSSADPIRIDQDVLGKIRSMVHQFTRPGNPVRLTLTVAKDGAIIDLKLWGAPLQVENRVKNYLRSRSLVTIASPLTSNQVRIIDL